MADERDSLIVKLAEGLEVARGEIERLRALVEHLQAQLSQNSSNSSKPPSSDGPGTMRPGQKATGKKRGGQAGHKHHARKLVPADQVTSSSDVVPHSCRRCTAPLVGRDPEPLRVQSFELPVVRPDVHEVRLHQLRCNCCGTTTRGALPADFETYGQRLRATMAALTGRFRLSKREAQALMSSMLDVNLSLGSVSNIERNVSDALEAVVEQARAFVRKQQVANLDETGWRESNQRAWLWTAVTRGVTVFRLARSRGGNVAREMLGENFSGAVGCDRWSGYNWLDIRQLCWSHLSRDVQGFVDRAGIGGQIGALLQVQIDKMFRWYGQVRDGTLDRAAFRFKMMPVEALIEGLFDDARTRAEPKTRGMAREIYDHREFLFVFVDNPDVEPTNNAAERAIRPAVLWRKGCFGTDSERGSRFVERLLTVVASLKQQGRDLLDFLVAACSGQHVSLLPLGR